MEDKNMDACNRDAKISGGKSVISREDKLVLLPVGHLYNAVKSPKPELAQAIRNLRIVKDVSKEQYDRQKRSLPYFAAIYRFSVRYFLSRDSLASAAGHMRGSIAGPGSSMF